MKPITMHSRVRAYLAHRRKLGFVLSIAVLTHVRGKGSLNEMKVGGTNMPTDVI